MAGLVAVCLQQLSSAVSAADTELESLAGASGGQPGSSSRYFGGSSIYESARISFSSADSVWSQLEPELGTSNTIKSLVQLEPRLEPLFSEDPSPDDFYFAITATELLRSSIDRFRLDTSDTPEINAAKRLALALISATLASPEKCRFNHLVQFHIWLVRHTKMPSLVNFMERNMKQQLDTCVEALNQQVEASHSIPLEPELEILGNELGLFDSYRGAQVPTYALEQSLAKLVGSMFRQVESFDAYKMMLVTAIQMSYQHECEILNNFNKPAIKAYELIIWFAGSKADLALTPTAWRLVSKLLLCKRLAISELGPTFFRSYKLLKAGRGSVFNCFKCNVSN